MGGFLCGPPCGYRERRPLKNPVILTQMSVRTWMGFLYGACMLGCTGRFILMLALIRTFILLCTEISNPISNPAFAGSLHRNAYINTENGKRPGGTGSWKMYCEGEVCRSIQWEIQALRPWDADAWLMYCMCHHKYLHGALACRRSTTGSCKTFMGSPALTSSPPGFPGGCDIRHLHLIASIFLTS